MVPDDAVIQTHKALQSGVEHSTTEVPHDIESWTGKKKLSDRNRKSGTHDESCLSHP